MAADETEAANHYAAAARRGYARAQNNLAVCYADGRGRAPDSRLAVQWWKTAAASVSIQRACSRRSFSLWCSDLLPCSQGDATALTWLGVVYWTGWGGVPTDDVAAEDYFQRAAALGDADAQSWLEELRSGVAG